MYEEKQQMSEWLRTSYCIKKSYEQLYLSGSYDKYVQNFLTFTNRIYFLDKIMEKKINVREKLMDKRFFLRFINF